MKILHKGRAYKIPKKLLRFDQMKDNLTMLRKLSISTVTTDQEFATICRMEALFELLQDIKRK